MKAHKNKVPWEIINDDIVIKVPKYFNYEVNLNYLMRNLDECMFKIDNNCVMTVISTTSNDYLINLTNDSNDKLHIKILTNKQSLNEQDLKEIVNYVIDWFHLDYDLTLFYKMASNDPLLKPVIKDLQGLRLCGVPNLFEALCWGIIGQQINLPFAYQLKKQFVTTFGKSIDYKNDNYWIFPKAETIAKLTIDDFNNIKMTTRKKEYLLGIAELMATGQLTKAGLREHNDLKTAEKTLTKIRGIGPWTANYVLMRCLRYENAFPIADVGLHNAIKKLKNLPEKPTKPLLQSLGERWDPFQAYATFYLWRTLY